MDISDYKFIVVGAGFFGSVIAERIANDKNAKVLLIDKRDHVGGNCYSEIDKTTGIEYHRYGTHIFHTSDQEVLNYLKKFTSFNSYRHQVFASYKDKLYRMPINLETINSFFKTNLRPYQVDAFLKKEIMPSRSNTPKNLEEKAVSLIGKTLYNAFIKGYTEKQWRKDPKSLPSSIIERIPIRNNYDCNYFHDLFQGLPLNGYGELFNLMLKNRNIKILLGLDFSEIVKMISKEALVIYSGAIDQYYNYKFGKLEWRSLKFEKEIKALEDYQGTSVVNYPELSKSYIRIHEPKHLHPERKYDKSRTIIIREYSGSATQDFYYPVNTDINESLLKRYQKESAKNANVIFGGRLGSYKYYDMDRVIAAALHTYRDKIKNWAGNNGKR